MYVKKDDKQLYCPYEIKKKNTGKKYYCKPGNIRGGFIFVVSFLPRK